MSSHLPILRRNLLKYNKYVITNFSKILKQQLSRNFEIFASWSLNVFWPKCIELKENRNNLDLVWPTVKKFNGPFSPFPPFRTFNGLWTRNYSVKGNLFVDHLRPVYTPNNCNRSVHIPSTVFRSAIFLKLILRKFNRKFLY